MTPTKVLVVYKQRSVIIPYEKKAAIILSMMQVYEELEKIKAAVKSLAVKCLQEE